MNLSTLQGLAIPEGEVVEITDAAGNMLWQLITATDEPPAIFEVAKQTNNSYAGETQYTDNEFILFDIYPKKGGTVKVTYGGLTKTIKDTSGAEEPNAIQVFFGKFNGESDSVATPASGRLTIEGAYRGYGLGSFGNYSGKTSGGYAPCVTNVIDFGNPVYIGERTFYGCTSLALTSLPSGITEIGDYAFYNCSKICITEFPEGLTSIGSHAFYMTTTTSSDIAMYGKRITFPSTIESIGEKAFQYGRSASLGGEKRYFTYVNTAIMLSETPPTLGADAFGDQGYYSSDTYISIVVPKGCGETYKSADDFSQYASKITEAS